MALTVCVGDSITYAEHLDPKHRWTTLLGLVNRGVCGDTTRLGLLRFPSDVQALRPATVVIQFGLNDCNRWDTDGGLPRVSRAAFAANLAEMIDRARTFGASHVVVAATTPTLRCAQFEWDSRIYSAVARAVASSRRVTLFDPRPLFPDPDRVLLDDVHLNADGNRIYADALRGLL